jgi:hypothetical protein
VQLKLQQSFASVHTSPSVRQVPPAEQRRSPAPKSMQLRLQQAASPPARQSSPAGRQPPPASHWSASVHRLEQQSLATEQGWVLVAQRVSTHTPP